MVKDERDRPRNGAEVGGLLVALFMAALAFRPQLVGVAPLLPSIQDDLGLSHAAIGLIATIPVLCMGVFAPVAPLVAAHVGTFRSVAFSLLLIGGFGTARAGAGDGLQLTVLTIGIGVGMGIAGVLLPVFVKERLADRVVLGSVAYSSGLQLGAAASVALAVPIASALGSWRDSLAVFSVLTLGLLVPWLKLAGRSAGLLVPGIRLTRAAFTDRRGWQLALVFALFGTVYYGFIAWLADAYVEAGWTPAAAGQLVALLNVAALVGALTVAFADRSVGYSASVTMWAAGFALATVGFILVPSAGWLWAVLAGYTNGALFPLVLALPLRLVNTPSQVAGLSTVMLGVGYTLAALGPVGIGAIRDATGTFEVSLVLLAVAAGLFAASVSWLARLSNSRAAVATT